MGCRWWIIAFVFNVAIDLAMRETALRAHLYMLYPSNWQHGVIEGFRGLVACICAGGLEYFLRWRKKRAVSRRSNAISETR